MGIFNYIDVLLSIMSFFHGRAACSWANYGCALPRKIIFRRKLTRGDSDHSLELIILRGGVDGNRTHVQWGLYTIFYKYSSPLWNRCITPKPLLHKTLKVNKKILVTASLKFHSFSKKAGMNYSHAYNTENSLWELGSFDGFRLLRQSGSIRRCKCSRKWLLSFCDKVCTYQIARMV